MIRHAVTADIPEIVRMAREFKKDSPYKFLSFSDDRVRDMIDNILRNENFVLLVGEQDNKIVGMLVGTLTKLLFSEDRVASELVWWVDLEYRTSGIGQQLHKAFEDWCQGQAKLISMVLLEDENLEQIDKMYNKFGYRPAERSYIKELV